jgi:DNA invertase Pin-like site-specific DNA recombinase
MRQQSPYAYHEQMDDKEMDRVVKELLRLPGETTKHREAISRIAVKRRELAGRLGEAIGPTEAARKLGVSRQTFWQILNPEHAKEIKRRSRTGRRNDEP